MMRFIFKNRKAILPLILALFLLLCPLTGCKETAPPAKPAVVTKRVQQEAPQTTAADKEQVKPAAEVLQPKTEKKEAPVAEAVQSKAEKREEPAAGAIPEQPAAADVKTSAAPSETAQSEMTQPSVLDAEKAAEEESLKDRLLDDTIAKYDPTGKMDPFASLFSLNATDSVSEDTEPKRPLTPLEKIDISQLQLKSVMQASSRKWAMVQDAAGKGYILERGTFIGMNSGIVTKILEDRIIIEEKSKDIFGNEKTSTRELKLQKPFGEE